MNFLINNDYFVLFFFSKAREKALKKNNSAFGAPYPFLFTTNKDEKVLFRTGNTIKSRIGNITVSVPGFGFHIGPDTSLTLWNLGFENIIFSEKQGNLNLIELLFVVRLGETINRHNYFDFFEELVVELLFQIKKFKAIGQ